MTLKDTPMEEEHLRLTWQAPKNLIGLSFTNFLLRILTVGIYHFWAKTEVRQRIWSAIRINGEPLIYTGRGIELLLGFLIVLLAVFLPFLLLTVGAVLVLGPNNPLVSFITLPTYALFAYLIGIAIYRAQRYRLARTRWRGIRGSLEGSPAAYAWTYFWTLLLIPLTLGWIIPWRTTKLQGMITNNIRFGDRPLHFNARSGPLYGPFAVMWFGTLLIFFIFTSFLSALLGPFIQQSQQQHIPVQLQLGSEVVIALIASAVSAWLIYAIVSAWYQARTTNHFANHTHFENARFQGNLSALGLVWLSFSNFLIVLAGVLILTALLIGLALSFIDTALLRIPEGRAITQALIGFAPLLLLLGFTLFSPIVQARTAGYIIQNMKITGTVPVAEIAQSAGADLKYGEGLAEAFDVDAF